MGAEYINNSPEINYEDEYPFQIQLNPFPYPVTNLEKVNLPEEDFDKRLYYIDDNQNQLEEKSNESSIIKERKDTKESTNNQITPVVSEKDSNKKVSNIFLVENKKLLGNKTGRKPKDENKNKKQKNKTINNFRENMTWMIS